MGGCSLRTTNRQLEALNYLSQVQMGFIKCSQAAYRVADIDGLFSECTNKRVPRN